MTHAEDLASLLGPDAVAELVEAIRSGGHIDVALDAPPDGGTVSVKVTRVKQFGGKRTKALTLKAV